MSADAIARIPTRHSLSQTARPARRGRDPFLSPSEVVTMCGIVGYVGQREAEPLLLAGLQRLEYRGYDSAGVATVSDSSRRDGH